MRGCCRWCPDGVSRATCLLRTPEPAGRPEIGWCPASPTCFTQAGPFGHFSSLPDEPPCVVGKLQKSPLLPVTVQPLASATFQESPNQGTFSSCHYTPPCPRKTQVPAQTLIPGHYWMPEQGCLPLAWHVLLSWGRVSTGTAAQDAPSQLPKGRSRSLWSGLSSLTPTQVGLAQRQWGRFWGWGRPSGNRNPSGTESSSSERQSA